MTRDKGIHIVMFSAEATPYVKVGGLADVVGALPAELGKLGAELTLILPAYQSIPRGKFEIRPADSVEPFEVPMGSESVKVEVLRSRVPDTKIDVYFVGGGGYFAREGVYDDPATREGYTDNMQRFTFFSKAGLRLIEKIGDPVDVIHCHDSQTALIPGLLRTVLAGNRFFSRAGTLFTIHNLAYQGIYGREALYWAGIDENLFYPTSSFEYWGRVNFMKIAIETADLVSTVSETYAREIQSGPEYGYGLEGVLRNRSRDLSGIVNGIDYRIWSPETDKLIPGHYSSKDLSGKKKCKAELLKAFGLPAEDRIPLIGIVSRLADQKGFDLIGEEIDRIAGERLQMAVLGTGQQKYHELFRDIAKRHPDRIGVKLAFDNRIAHWIEAGADMFLMPSRYEPCGLNQLYSLRYGTIPVVRATGGLADTVIDVDADPESGTGFRFVEYTGEEMMATIRRALGAYSDAKRWQRLMQHAMAQDWSWGESARRYMGLYEKLYRAKHS